METKYCYYVKEGLVWPGTYHIVAVINGENGYCQTVFPGYTDKKKAIKAVDELNENLGISKKEADKIVARSMFTIAK